MHRPNSLTFVVTCYGELSLLFLDWNRAELCVWHYMRHIFKYISENQFVNISPTWIKFCRVSNWWFSWMLQERCTLWTLSCNIILNVIRPFVGVHEIAFPQHGITPLCRCSSNVVTTLSQLCHNVIVLARYHFPQSSKMSHWPIVY